jgi:hypothetical protein
MKYKLNVYMQDGRMIPVEYADVRTLTQAQDKALSIGRNGVFVNESREYYAPGAIFKIEFVLE